MRPFTVIGSALFAIALAVATPVQAKSDKPQTTSSAQRHPAKAKSAPWHLGWLSSKAKPSKPKPPRCRR